MKALGVYYHCTCAKAEFVTLVGPRGMGPSPHEQRGVFLCYIIEGGAGGPPTPLKMTKLPIIMITRKIGMT